MTEVIVYASLLQGPFATFKLPLDRNCEWTGLKFSNDGKLILVSTNGGALRLLDAFKGAVLHCFGVCLFLQTCLYFSLLSDTCSDVMYGDIGFFHCFLCLSLNFTVLNLYVCHLLLLSVG